MTIDFKCPSCATAIRTPDSSGGKKGKCPKCAAVVEIPAASPGPTAQTPVAKVSLQCPSCDHALQVPVSLAGKRGKCPRCQSVILIPASNEEPGFASNDGLTPLGDEPTPSDDPFGDLSSDPLAFPATPFAASGGAVPGAAAPVNPYSATVASPTASVSSSQQVKDKVMPPAIALISSAAISLVIFIAYGVLQVVMGAATPPPELDEAGATGYQIGFVCGIFLPVIINAVCLAGAIAMLRMKSYAGAMTAAIIAIIPCSGICLVGSIPVGIWALIVLLSEDVKRGFR